LRTEKLIPYFLLLPTIVMIISLTIMPLTLSLWASFHKWDMTMPEAEISFVGLENYQHAIFGDSRFIHSLITTSIFMIASIGAEFIIGLGIASILAQEIRGKGIIRSLLVLPVILPDIVTGYIFRLMYNYDAGPVNYLLSRLSIMPVHWLEEASGAIAGMIVTEVWQWTPFMVMILLAGLLSIPIEPLEAAKVDGTSTLQMFRYVTLPLIRPIIILALLLRTVDALKAFGMIHMLTAGGPGNATEVLSLYIYTVAFKYFNFGYAAALTYLTLIIATVITTIFIKYLRYK